MGKRIVFDESRCTFCHLCTMFCSLAFGQNGVHEIRPSIARIRAVENSEGNCYVAHVCLQCEDPACAEACPSEAISVDPGTGVVNIDEELCTGCGSCIDACEYGCVFMADGKAVKCEVCDDPLCVMACSEKALSIEETDWETVRQQAKLYREVPL